MLKIKKNNALIMLLLCITTFNSIYTMEPESYPKGAKWVALVGGVLLGAVVVQQLLSYISSERERQIQSSEGEQQSIELPIEDIDLILSFIFKNNSAESLADATKTINSLAQVNKELNEMINDHQFCKNLIKHLAQKFDCDALTVVKNLQTKEANKIELLILCSVLENIINSDDLTFELERLYRAGVDLNYIYSGIELERPYGGGKYFKYKKIETLGNLFSATPLMILCGTPRRMETDHILPEVLDFLFAKNVNVNATNNEGVTALMLTCGGFGFALYLTDWIFNRLIKVPNIDINQQDNQGNTALIHFILSGSSDGDKLHSLILAGADPELPNFAGETPLQLLQRQAQNDPRNQFLVDYIQRVIAYKASWIFWIRKKLGF